MPQIDNATKAILAVTAILIVGVVLWAVVFQKTETPALARDTCVEHGFGSSMHIHQRLTIDLDGQIATPPANTGISPTCMKALHTHQGEDGVIHVEFPEQHEFHLSDFFANWGQPFNKNQILNKTVDSTHEIIMTVNGTPSNDFENLVLKDGQQILIKYQKKSAEATPSAKTSTSSGKPKTSPLSL